MNGKDAHLPAFPYGAVYYRVSNPPSDEWERDYATASEDANTIFRHWFLWSAIERSPGVYRWDEYDRQLDLAAEHGMRTIIAEMITVAPEWTARLHPHARLQWADDRRSEQAMHGSCATGGIDMCLDNDDLRERAGEFLVRLAERYRDHPGLGGYDIWNECNMPSGCCYCSATIARFRSWLVAKYATIEALRDAWWRPGMADWDDVTPPRRLQPYNDSLDWLKFRLDNAHGHMAWRRAVIESVDPDHRITAHGLGLGHRLLAPSAADDWRAAALVDSYGLTWGSSRHGDEPWKQPRAMDFVRCASRGKPFWHAEAYGGPLWFAPNVQGKPRDGGRICRPEDIRYWNLTSYMHGARGTFYLRWRPLLDGILFGAFGPYAMDGSRTDRSRMSTRIARWVKEPAQERLWKSGPISGEVGILFDPECQLFTYAHHHATDWFAECHEGAYRGFHDRNIQADYVHVDDLEQRRFLYYPYPVMMSGATARRISDWVRRGGILVCEGCPGYWGDQGRVGQHQPNLGLDELFGAREAYVEFTPDLLDEQELTLLGERAPGGLYLQAYEPTTGEAIGWYPDGRVAAVTNTFGDGKTLLIGTMLSRGYGFRGGSMGGEVWDRIFGFGCSVPQYVRRSDPRIRARLHDGEGGTYLWVANPLRHDLPVVLDVAPAWTFTSVRTLWGADASAEGNRIRLIAPGRDVTVLALER